jgi:hypothetical protein
MYNATPWNYPWPKASLVKMPTLSCLEKWHNLLFILTRRVHFREAFKVLHTFGIYITYPTSLQQRWGLAAVFLRHPRLPLLIPLLTLSRRP